MFCMIRADLLSTSADRKWVMLPISYDFELRKDKESFSLWDIL